MTRERLPNRRTAESFDASVRYTATVGRFADGRLAEVFLRGAKVDSATDAAAKDAAVVCSISLQYGAPVEVIRHALLRSANSVAASPLGEALDRLETKNGHAANATARPELQPGR
jgi:hypothetical protein